MTRDQALQLKLHGRVLLSIDEELLGTVALVRRNGVGVDFDDGEYRFLRWCDFADLSLL